MKYYRLRRAGREFTKVFLLGFGAYAAVAAICYLFNFFNLMWAVTGAIGTGLGNGLVHGYFAYYDK